VALDKSEGVVKSIVLLGGARAPLLSPEKVEDQDPGISRVNHFSVEGRFTNHRFDHCVGHDSSMRTSRLSGMRERPIGLACADRATRGLLSIRTTTGFGCCVRSIQYSRMANLRATATLATASGLEWQRC